MRASTVYGFTLTFGSEPSVLDGLLVGERIWVNYTRWSTGKLTARETG